MRNRRRLVIVPRRVFYASERRVFCGCELCRMRFGRLLYARDFSGDPLGMGWRAMPRYHSPFKRWSSQ